MKQSKIIAAFNATTQLSELEFSETEQWKIYKLRKFLRPHYDFQVEREQAIQQKYIDYIDEDGTIKGEEAKQFLKEINDIGDLEIELEDFTKTELHVVKGVTFKLIEPLEDFIEFVPPAE